MERDGGIFDLKPAPFGGQKYESTGNAWLETPGIETDVINLPGKNVQ
jgi:hypothetical protein